MKKIITALASLSLALTLTACGTDTGSAIGLTEDGRPVYAFPSDDAIREAVASTEDEREMSSIPDAPAGDIYKLRKSWNGQADYTCTRVQDGHSLEEIAADSYGPLIAHEDQLARLNFIIEKACPELAK